MRMERAPQKSHLALAPSQDPHDPQQGFFFVRSVTLEITEFQEISTRIDSASLTHFAPRWEKNPEKI